jgi:hypothetical protein
MMIVRAVPLALCLLWLAYESRFSPSFFVATVGTSLSLMAEGVDDLLAGPIAVPARPVVAQSE